MKQQETVQKTINSRWIPVLMVLGYFVLLGLATLYASTHVEPVL